MYANNPEIKLNKPENFIKSLIEIPQYELRINLMLFLEEFDGNFNKLNDLIEKTNRLCAVLHDDESLKEFLQIVLITGNYLNMVISIKILRNINKFIFKLLLRVLIIVHVVLRYHS